MTDGEIVETGPTEAIFAAARSIPTPGICSPPSPRAPRPVRPTSAAPVVEAQRHQGHFPIQRGLLQAHRRLRQGGRRRHASTVRAGQTVGVVGESGSGKTTLGLALLRLHRERGRDPFRRTRTSRAGPASRCGRSAARCRSSSRTRTAASARACRSARSSAKGSILHRLGGNRGRARQAGRSGAGGGRPRPGDPGPLPARVLRRPAPAHRHRPGDGAQAALRRARRADLGARHVGAGADRRPAARPAGAATASPICSSATT